MKIKKDKLERLKETHDKALTKVTNTEVEMINEICKNYNDQDYRDSFIKDAENTGFSREKLKNIKKAFHDFNEDDIDYNVVEDIMDARQHIMENKKESFFSKIANIIPEDKNGK